MTATPTLATRLEYIRLCPKVELHVHLEGGLERDRLLALLRRHDRHSEIQKPSDLDFLYRHRSLEEFLEHFRFGVTCLRDVQDVHDVALDVFTQLAKQNVVYAEVLFSAGIFTEQGMPLEELLAAVCEAESAAQSVRPRRVAGSEELVPRFQLVVDLVRNLGPNKAVRMVEALGHEGHPRVVGVHLGGDEVAFPARLFETAFRVAREAGLGLAAHAGEADGPQSVWDAIDRLGATRIGHGVRSLEDPDLVRELAQRQTVLEMCPGSNVATGVVPSLAVHPLPEFLKQGVWVTLGSDDPSYFETNLELEMRAVHQELGLGLEVLDRMMDVGLEGAFLVPEERERRLASSRAMRSEVRQALHLASIRQKE